VKVGEHGKQDSTVPDALFGYHRAMVGSGSEAVVNAEIVRGLAIGVVVQTIVALGLRAWARRLTDRAPAWGRHVPILPLVGLGLILLGLGGTIFGLVRAFAAVASVDPARKAQVLASAIAEAMNSTALFALPGFVLYLLTGIYCIAYSLRGAARP
jgi:hypothetical protein